MEAIVITQKCLHSTKSKIPKTLVLKMDLAKVSNKVDRGFLRLVLMQIGVPLDVTNWILAYVSLDIFSIIINASPCQFFSSSQGPRKGCPLLLLLFLLVIKGFRRLISKAKLKGKFSGMKVATQICITR